MATRPRPVTGTPTRLAGLLVRTLMALILLLVSAAACGAARAAAASSSPAAAGGNQPLVNWGWLAVGLGGVVLLLIVMFLLTRVFGRARKEDD